MVENLLVPLMLELQWLVPMERDIFDLVVQRESWEYDQEDFTYGKCTLPSHESKHTEYLRIGVPLPPLCRLDDALSIIRQART